MIILIHLHSENSNFGWATRKRIKIGPAAYQTSARWRWTWPSLLGLPTISMRYSYMVKLWLCNYINHMKDTTMVKLYCRVYNRQFQVDWDDLKVSNSGRIMQPLCAEMQVSAELLHSCRVKICIWEMSAPWSSGFPIQENIFGGFEGALFRTPKCRFVPTCYKYLIANLGAT